MLFFLNNSGKLQFEQFSKCSILFYFYIKEESFNTDGNNLIHDEIFQIGQICLKEKDELIMLFKELKILLELFAHGNYYI